MGEVKRVGVRELRDNLSVWLREAEAGAEVVVVSRGKEVARLVPPRAREVEAKKPKRFGVLKGILRDTDDFGPLPDDIIDVMEGENPGASMADVHTEP